MGSREKGKQIKPDFYISAKWRDLEVIDTVIAWDFHEWTQVITSL